MLKPPAAPGERAAPNGLVIGFALFFIAFALRLIGINWGLPTQAHWYSYHPDEAQMLGAIASLDFFSGDLNPDFFNYPSLFITLSAFAHLVAGGLGIARPFSNDPTQTWIFVHDVLLCARVVNATLGAATVPLVFLIARQIGGWKTGVLAALLMAFAPGHLQHSHFATVDVPATFFITLCLWLSLRALQENAASKWSARQLLWAAFAAGLATATKYNAALVLVAPLAAWFFLMRKKSVSIAIAPAIVGVAIIAFLLACPFSVLDFATFWGDGKNAGVAYELLVHPRQGHGDVFTNTGNGWIYHLTFNAPFLLTLPVLLMSLLGLGSTLTARHKANPALIILAIWCGLYFLALGFSNVRFLRYLIPLAPALCIFAAQGVLPLRRFGPILTRAAAIFLVAASVWGARDVIYPFIVEDPRDRAADYVRYNASSSVGVSATIGMIDPPWFFSPPLSPLDSPPYRRLSPSQLSQYSGGKYQFVLTGFDAQKLKEKKPQWFVLSEFEWREKARLGDADFQKFLATLEASYTIAERFKNAAPLSLPGRDFVPHDFLYPNPEIRVYRRK